MFLSVRHSIPHKHPVPIYANCISSLTFSERTTTRQSSTRQCSSFETRTPPSLPKTQVPTCWRWTSSPRAWCRRTCSSSPATLKWWTGRTPHWTCSLPWRCNPWCSSKGGHWGRCLSVVENVKIVDWLLYHNNVTLCTVLLKAILLYIQPGNISVVEGQDITLDQHADYLVDGIHGVAARDL